MCGLGCVWFREGVSYGILSKMLLETEVRGNDAFGYAIIRDFKIIENRHFAKTFSKCNVKIDDLLVGDIVIWNNRAAPMTELPTTGIDTIQPIIYEKEGLILVHNGCVANVEPFNNRTNIDSEYFLHRYLENGKDAVKTVEEMVGGSAYIIIDLNRRNIIAIRDFKVLGKAYKKGVGYFLMSDSEKFFNIFGDMDIAVWEHFYFSDIMPFTVNEIDIDSGLIDRKPFVSNYVSSLPEQDKDKVVVCASGGVDSSVAACLAKFHLNKEVILVHFDIGQKNEIGELKAVNYLSNHLGCELKVIDLKWLGDLGASVLTDVSQAVPLGSVKSNLKNTVCWVPARNLVMCSVLMAVAEATGASEIYNGWTLEEESAYCDNSLDFFRSLNNVSLFGTLKHPKIRMIEANLMKPEIIKLANYYGLYTELLWSCDTYSENGKECSYCGACFLKQMAIEKANTLDRSIKEILRKVHI